MAKAMKPARQAVYDKYGGRCAYCGCELNGSFHVDHIEPIRRNRKWVNGRWVADGMVHPEREALDNKIPSCASCNINKHSESVEGFRALITGFINSLNQYSTQYKIAKRYGLISETQKPIVFYFETFKQ